MIALSVIIVSYNTKDLTRKAIEAVQASLTSFTPLDFEIIVVDNASTDGSVEMLTALSRSDQTIHVHKSHENIGFGAANNIGINKSQGKYVLFLNSDVIADRVDFNDLLQYMDQHSDVGALTVRVNLMGRGIDPASHRGFPTIWRSISYFTHLEDIFQHVPFFSKVFGGYHLTHLNKDILHEIDSPTGAFYFTRREILEQLNGFDEAYFMYGEDLDLSYRIKEKGYKIIYYPHFTVLHLKRQSGLEKENNVEQQRQTKKHFYHAMKIFYDTHYAPHHHSIINSLVHKAIHLKSRL